MTRTKRAGRTLAAVTLPLLTLVACGDDSDTEAGGSGVGGEQVDPADLAEVPGDLTLTVAEQSGNFKESVAFNGSGQGDDVSYQVDFASFNGGPAVLEAILAGGADIGSVGEAPLPIAASNGVDDLVAVAVKANPGSSGNYYLVAQPGSGIESVEDLEGHSVAYPPGTGRHMIVAGILDDHGLSLDGDVDGVEVAGSEVAPTFSSGAVDAAIVLGYQYYNLGEPPIVEDGRGYNWGISVLAVRRDTLDDPDKVAAVGDFVRREVAAANWGAAHPADWVRLNYVDDLGLTQEQGQALVDEAGFQRYYPIDDDLIAAWQTVADGLERTGASEGHVDVRDLVDDRYNDLVTAQNEEDGVELRPLEQ
jgi:ABC-type nitrate/sulfonate/bicarbonate transport system substrate-binding protein